MPTMDITTIVLLMAGSAILGALVVILPGWRRAMAGGQGVPLWKFLARYGLNRGDLETRLGSHAAADAELRCAVCGARMECLDRLAADRGPVAHCPNLALLSRVDRDLAP